MVGLVFPAHGLVEGRIQVEFEVAFCVRRIVETCAEEVADFLGSSQAQAFVAEDSRVVGHYPSAVHFDLVACVGLEIWFR